MSSITAVPLQPVKRRVLVYVWAGIMIAVLGAFALAWMAPTDPATAFLAGNRKVPGVVQTASGLQYMILKPGKAIGSPTDQDITLINYEGKLLNGTTFDKSQRPTPMPVAAADEKSGRQGVVPGFSEALKLMTKGAKYRFWIKPSLAYGDKAGGVRGRAAGFPARIGDPPDADAAADDAAATGRCSGRWIAARRRHAAGRRRPADRPLITEAAIVRFS